MKTNWKLLSTFLVVLLFACSTNETVDNQEAAERGIKDLKCETAFAYCDDGSNCFIDNGFNRWGWSLGPIEAPYKEICNLYAGAAHCDTDNGEEVGFIDFDYDLGVVRVHFTAYEGYLFHEIHLYVGNQMFPLKPNGKPTVAPGQYPYSGEYPEGTDYVQFNLEEEFEGEIYIIAHAVVCTL